MSDADKALSFIEKMKLKAQSQENYGGKIEVKEPGTTATTCSNCGAGSAKQDGLSKCAYCGFEFITVELSDGLYTKKDNNSK